jgi:hypothetical protein
VRIPARRLSLESAEAGRFAPFLAMPPGELHRHQKRQVFLLQEFHHRDVEKRPIQQEVPDFQADFADPGQQPPQHGNHRFVASNPTQGQGVTSSV